MTGSSNCDEIYRIDLHMVVKNNVKKQCQKQCKKTMSKQFEKTLSFSTVLAINYTLHNKSIMNESLNWSSPMFGLSL